MRHSFQRNDVCRQVPRTPDVRSQWPFPIIEESVMPYIPGLLSNLLAGLVAVFPFVGTH